MVPMDAVLIEQVLINLLENAVVHAESTEPIECYVESLSDYAIFHVRDYGVGIPSEKLATIFDGSSSTTSTSPDGRKGMGIGLSICKTIIPPTAAKSRQSTTRAVPNFTLPFQRRTNNMTHKLSILLVEDEKTSATSSPPPCPHRITAFPPHTREKKHFRSSRPSARI